MQAVLRAVYGTDESMRRQRRPDMVKRIDEGVQMHTMDISPMDRAEIAIDRLDKKLDAAQMVLDHPALTIEQAMMQIARRQ